MTVDVTVPARDGISDVEPIKQQQQQQRQQQQKPLHNLFSHTLISQDFDQLKFHTAASHQIQWHQKGDRFPPTADTDTDTDSRLIASPYNSAPHLLDLETLDTQSRLFSLALASFKPVRDDYATAEYLDSFNWQEVFDLVRTFCNVEGHTWTTQSFYVVIFRSKLQPGVDQDYLHALDAYSHQEAMKSGGLLKYWFGTKNEKRQNLATCIWRSREDARHGGRGPWHAKARVAARELYEQIVFTTMRLVIDDGVASWDFSDWKDEVAGPKH